jgi:hypothetical protein
MQLEARRKSGEEETHSKRVTPGVQDSTCDLFIEGEAFMSAVVQVTCSYNSGIFQGLLLPSYLSNIHAGVEKQQVMWNNIVWNLLSLSRSRGN